MFNNSLLVQLIFMENFSFSGLVITSNHTVYNKLLFIFFHSSRKFDKQRDKSPMSPRNFDFPDVRMDYDYDPSSNYVSNAKSNDRTTGGAGTPPTIHRGYSKSPTSSAGAVSGSGGSGSHRQHYDNTSQYDQPQTSRSPRGSRSLEYGAVSPQHTHKKFEYYQPSSPDNDDEDSSYADYRHSVMYYGKKKKPYNKSPNGVSSLDDYNSSSAGYGQRNSIVTESSGGSDFSTATTARCGSSGTETEGRGSSRRRHAINITNNPAYQVSS